MKSNDQLYQVGTMTFDQRTGRIGYQRINTHNVRDVKARAEKAAPIDKPAIDERAVATALLKDAFKATRNDQWSMVDHRQAMQ